MNSCKAVTNLPPCCKSLKVVAHFDLDSFYVQVERKLDPALIGVPVAVVQVITCLVFTFEYYHCSTIRMKAVPS